MDTLYISFALGAGALLAVQAAANAQLAKATASPFAAATMQLAAAGILLLVVTLVAGNVAALSLLPSAQWWHAGGGMASAFYVVAGILLFPRIGAVVAAGLFITGQVLASTTLDVFGLLGVPAKGFHAGVAIAATAVITGAALIVIGQGRRHGEASPMQPGWIALGIVAGAVLPLQGAVNALLSRDLGGATFAVGTVSFAVATLTMAAAQIAAIGLLGAGKPNLNALPSMPWWGWLGAVAGASYVTTVFTAMPAIGAAMTVSLTVAGQQIAAVLVDAHGWLRLPQRPVSGTRLMGVAILLAGVGTVRLL